MKTPEEIKKGLDHCGNCVDANCDSCPFRNENDIAAECITRMSKDALAYIQHLEIENASLDKAVRDAAELMVSGTELMSKRIIELEMERDATLKKLKAYEWYEGE